MVLFITANGRYVIGAVKFPHDVIAVASHGTDQVQYIYRLHIISFGGETRVEQAN